jgi:hypothetical protein
MHTLIVVLSALSCLLFGFAAATHLGARARALLTDKLKQEREKALKSSSSELGSLKAEVKKLKASNKGGQGGDSDESQKAEKLKKELQSAKDTHANELKKLKEQLSSAEAESAGGDVTRLEEKLKGAGKGLDQILAAFVGDQGQKAALLSDDTGIMIASAGDTDTIDGAAAAASMLTSIPKQLNNLVPLKKHFTFQLEDGTNSIVGKAFESHGELVALTTVGPHAPSANSINITLDSLTTALK